MKILSNTTVYIIDNNKKCYLNTKHQNIMISERSCDTKD